jgi:hypothetical protein
MSQRSLGTLLAVVAASGLILLSNTASFAEVRDHRNTAGKIYSPSGRGAGCYRCATTGKAQGGVLVTTKQGSRQTVVPTNVGPPGGGFGGTVRDQRGK